MASAQVFSDVVESLLAAGVQVRVRAAGRSMLPTIRNGECLVIAPVAQRAIERGDVLLFETWRGLLAHRVLAIEIGHDGARRFTLRGDASLDSDRPVLAAAVVGRVVGVERAGRTRSLAVMGGDLGRLWLAARLRLRPALDVARGWLGSPGSVVTAS